MTKKFSILRKENSIFKCDLCFCSMNDEHEWRPAVLWMFDCKSVCVGGLNQPLSWFVPADIYMNWTPIIDVGWCCVYMPWQVCAEFIKVETCQNKLILKNNILILYCQER